jgi:hypothetical protein
LFGASRLARAREGLQRMVDLDQSRQISAEPKIFLHLSPKFRSCYAVGH